MEKLVCAGCCAPIAPTTTQAFLTCEYCGTSIPNPYYSEVAAKEAAKPSLAEACIAQLLEMGAAQNLADLDSDCFGNPLNAIDTARAGLSISDAHQVYLLYDHTYLLLGFSDGLALTDGGVYYKCDSGAGSLSWEAFVTGAISCVDRTDDQHGTLKIGSSVEVAVKSERDSRLARFLVDFHNHMYHLHTGETAPATWNVTEPVISIQAEQRGSSLLGGLIPAVGALLGTASAARRKTVIQRAPVMRPTSRPTAAPDRRSHIEPPRPLHSQPHHRSAPKAPGSMGRPGMGGPGQPGRPGGQRGPGGMGGQRGPGGPGRGRR